MQREGGITLYYELLACTILLDSRMSFQIEMELVNLKHQFDAELEKLDRGGKGNVEHLIQADLDPPTVSLSSSSKAEAPATLAKASPENQIRDHEKQKKRSEGLSRIFEEATRDIRDQLKRPSS